MGTLTDERINRHTQRVRESYDARDARVVLALRAPLVTLDALNRGHADPGALGQLGQAPVALLAVGAHVQHVGRIPINLEGRQV